MARQLQPGEIAGAVKAVLSLAEESTRVIKELLRDLEESTRKTPISVYLHDEIATAEELERLLGDVEIHYLTAEELEDR